MPRYLGYGVEIEEFVIHPSHQGQGLSAQLLDACINRYSKEPEVRRITIQTDDDRVGRIYAARMEHMRVFRFQALGRRL